MTSLNKKYNSRGFTLIEVLLVVAIIGILASIVIIAVNPGKQLGQTRNAQRQADVNTILNAAYQAYLDLHGVPGGLPNGATPTDICATGATSCSGYDFSFLTNRGVYLVSIPKDPQLGDNNNTHYQISQNPTSFRLTVSAPGAELGQTISVTR